MSTSQKIVGWLYQGLSSDTSWPGPSESHENGKCAGALQRKRQPDVGSVSRYIAEKPPVRHADHNECAAIETNVLAHGLLRRAESVARKIVAKHRGPLTLAHAFIGLRQTTAPLPEQRQAR